MDGKRKLLIKLRENNDLFQEDVADLVGTTQQNISLIENGKRNPSLVLAKKLETLFDTPMEELFPDIFLPNHTTKRNVNNHSA